MIGDATLKSQSERNDVGRCEICAIEESSRTKIMKMIAFRTLTCARLIPTLSRLVTCGVEDGNWLGKVRQSEAGAYKSK